MSIMVCSSAVLPALREEIDNKDRQQGTAGNRLDLVDRHNVFLNRCFGLMVRSDYRRVTHQGSEAECLRSDSAT